MPNRDEIMPKSSVRAETGRVRAKLCKVRAKQHRVLAKSLFDYMPYKKLISSNRGIAVMAPCFVVARAPR